MTNFNGITPKAIELLSENRFNDSKAFYEEHNSWPPFLCGRLFWIWRR